MTLRFAHVALPLPIFEPYTYAIPDALADRVTPGARAVVSVRRRELVGVVTVLDVPAPGAEAKPLLALPDLEPALTPSLLRVAEWIARYYGAPLGLALRAMLPAALWGASRFRLQTVVGAGVPGGVAGELLDWLESRGGDADMAAAQRAFKKPLWDVVDRLSRVSAITIETVPPREPTRAVERIVSLRGHQPTLLDRDRRFKRRPRQRELLERLEDAGGALAMARLMGPLQFSSSVIRGLIDAGLAGIDEIEISRDPFSGDMGTPPPEALTPAQQSVLREIDGLDPGAGALLFGVTGSGKTLVYLEAIREALTAGQGAILLVPEIALTPQTVSRLRGAFGDTVAVLHSALSDGERLDAWRALRGGAKRVAVGARSALFAPIPQLGVIILDEEHESSYKNGETPRYHARDTAMLRARLEGARLILGSATPSLDAFAMVGHSLKVLRLPERIGARPLPPIELIDLRRSPLVPGLKGVAWSEALDQAMVRALARHEQVLLLLNRRGFAAFLQCPSCGMVRTCSRCSISLTVHQSPAELRCHYCDTREPVPTACVSCGHAVQVMRGLGTQQLERIVAERFPTARIARMDLDTTTTKWSHHRILGAVERGEVDILLGTQMIAKGIDFPNVTLVGVVDADTGLHLPDFRAGERTFQLIAQVAGRAGRGPKGGTVLVQTRNPEHPALRFAAQHDADGFLAHELIERGNPPYPPMTGLVRIVVSGHNEILVAERCVGLADWCQRIIDKAGVQVEVLGPVPCPLGRIKERWRWHVVLKGPTRDLGRIVRLAAPRVARVHGVRVAIDRDPMTML